MPFQIVKLLDPIQMSINGTFNPMGAYNAATDYAVGDQVDYNGSSYIMYNNAAAGTVPTNTSYWGLVASKGDTGAAGADSTVPGPAGADGLTVSVNSVTQVAGNITIDPDDLDDTSTTHKFVTATDITKLSNLSGTNTGDQDLSTYQLKPSEGAFVNGDKTKLDGIETGADVTDATNVASAGAVMDGDFSSNGVMTRTAAGTYTSRTLTGTTNQITVTNGDGVSGNPTFSTPQDIHTGASPTFAGGTITGQLTMSDSTLNNGDGHLYTVGNKGLQIRNGTATVGFRLLPDGASNIYFQNTNTAGSMHFTGLNAAKLTGAVIFNADTVRPNANSVSSLGTSSLYWSNTYTDRLYLNSTAYIDGGTAGRVNITGTVKATVGAAKAFVGIATSGNFAMSLETPGNLAGDSIYFAVNNRGRIGYDGTGVLIDDNSASKRVLIKSNGNSWLFDTSGHFTPPDGGNIILGTTTGTKIGTATTQKLGFFDATPVVKPSATPANATDLATAITLVNDLKSKLVTLGLIA